MTTVYNAYYAAYDSKQLDLSNVSFLAMLTADTYVPDPNHTLSDVHSVIVAVPFVIVNDDIVTLEMSDIVKKALAEIKDYGKNYPQEVGEGYMEIFQDLRSDDFEKRYGLVLYDPSLDILCFSEEVMAIELNSV
jgi:hypothetical protein